MNSNKTVFISYSVTDKQVAFALCSYLENNSVPCWMAPRNISVGKDYAQAIMEGIESSAIMVLILSGSANESRHVRNEVERGFNHELVIMPFRVQNIMPGKSLEYFLSASHWLDAFDNKPQNYFPQLLTNCKAVLEINDAVKPAAVTTSHPDQKSNQSKKILFIAAVVCLAIAVVVVAIINTKKTEPKHNSAIVKPDSAGKQKPDNLPVNSRKDSGIVKQELPAATLKKQPAQKQAESILPTTTTSEKISPVSQDLADKITGTYWQPDGADELTFSSAGNQVFIEGRIGGTPVSARVSAAGNRNFKVSGSASGSLHVSADFESITGSLKSAGSMLMNVNLVRK